MALYDKIDEAAPDDADYIETFTPGSIAEVKLDSLTDPGVDTGHTFRVRAKGTGTLTTKLVQGSGAVIPLARMRSARQGVARQIARAPITEGLVDLWYGGSPEASLVRSSPALVVGTNSRIQAGPDGLALTTDSGFTQQGRWLALNSNLLFPSNDTATIVMFRRLTKTPAVSGVSFGYNSGNPDRVLAHVPWSDGNVYWDFGNSTSGSGRLGAAYGTRDTNPETLVFIAGPKKGREIWRRGVRLGNSTSSTASRASNTSSFGIGSAGLNSLATSDDEQIYLIAVFAREWTDAECMAFARNPWQLLTPVRTSRLISISNVVAIRNQALTDTVTTYDFALTEGEAANITDYTDLRLRFEAN